MHDFDETLPYDYPNEPGPAITGQGNGEENAQSEGPSKGEEKANDQGEVKPKNDVEVLMPNPKYGMDEKAPQPSPTNDENKNPVQPNQTEEDDVELWQPPNENDPDDPNEEGESNDKTNNAPGRIPVSGFY